MGYTKEDFSAFNPVADELKSVISYIERAGASRIDLRPLHEFLKSTEYSAKPI